MTEGSTEHLHGGAGDAADGGRDGGGRRSSSSGDVTVDRSSLTFSTSNWGTPQTVTVSLAQDDDAADDAAVTLTHTPSGGDYGAVPFASVTVTRTTTTRPG